MRKLTQLRLARIQCGLTLDDVYLRTGRKLVPSKLSRLERGIIQPSVKDLHLFAKALDTSVDEIAALFRGGEN